MAKNPPANAGDTEDTDSISGWGRAPGGRDGTHPSTLGWEIPWTEKTGGLQSTGSQRVDTTEHAHIPKENRTFIKSSVLPTYFIFGLFCNIFKRLIILLDNFKKGVKHI